jgi:cysteine-rich repeat protein
VSGQGGQKCVQGSPLTDGTKCTGGTCKGGVCQFTTCGNVTLDSGEQCDFGSTGAVSNNKPGSGCEPDCQFSCTKAPDSCSPTDLCNASPVACQDVTGPNTTQNGDKGQKCQAVTGTKACGTCDLTTTGDFVCVSNACAKSTCGDGCVDARTGEQCEPPNTATCDKSCHTIVPAVCGNSKRETGEQCDDGNTTNLDGCDSKCQFEQDHRANTVSIAYPGGTPAPTCTNNALGAKILTSTASSQLNPTLQTAVDNGTTNIQFKFMGITDLSGTSQTTGLLLGALSGTPTGTFNKATDTDWWFTTIGSTIDGSRNPTSQLAATFTATKLKATGTIDLHLVLGGANAVLHMSTAVITANAGAATKPATSTGAAPGHLAAENLDPALTSFASMSNGVLCGNISAASLATVPIPTQLTTGISACTTPVYATTNTLLDAIVNGCTAGGFLNIGVINATPTPDQTDPSVPAAGAGAPYTITSSNGTSADGCKDHTGAVVPLAACLAAGAYSADFSFTSHRAIMK